MEKLFSVESEYMCSSIRHKISCEKELRGYATLNRLQLFLKFKQAKLTQKFFSLFQIFFLSISVASNIFAYLRRLE
jgi:hypothetical protein